MKKRNMFYLVAILSVLALSGCSTGTEYNAFAQCLTDNDVKFYGAFWCPHCQVQKNMFGSSFENVNYIECSLPDRSDQTQICKDSEIKAYPTWEFADGKKIEGQLSFLQLSQLSGCNLS